MSEFNSSNDLHRFIVHLLRRRTVSSVASININLGRDLSLDLSVEHNDTKFPRWHGTVEVRDQRDQCYLLLSLSCLESTSDL